MESFIISGSNSTSGDLTELGGKAGALARLHDICLPIPQWFVIKSGAFHIPEEEAGRAIDEMLAHFEEGVCFAVRSSGKAEDGAQASFAGQFESYLWVERADVHRHVKLVWQSAFSERVRTYREHNNITGPIDPPAVLVQRMIRSEKAGVAFAANPLTADTGECVVSAVFGLGSALVDGSSDADAYTYRYRDGSVVAQTAQKTLDAEPLNRLIRPELFRRDLSCERVLTEEEIREIALLARITSDHFGRFQDIEWAIEDGKLYLLQSRPITTLAGIYEPTGRAFVFDNSNIAESYSGATTPLTFSFIRKAYSGVYEQFCRVFGVSEKVLGDNAKVFTQMLAFVDNRVYYNLFSWYKMLSLLPGYALNRQFMEQMMGVKEPLPEDFLQVIHDSVPSKGKASDTARLLRCIFKLLGNYIRLESHIAKFMERLESALEGPPLSQKNANELYDCFAVLESSLLKKWDAPIENDFFAMIFHGLLRGLCKKYGLPANTHNALLTGQGGIISTEPAATIRRIGRSIRHDKSAVETLGTGGLRDIRLLLRENTALGAELDAYLAQFGDRCVDELKLESVSLTENPLPLYRAVAASARAPRAHTAANTPPGWRPLLKGHPIRKGLFSFVLKNARRTVKNRENLRFERTRLFGRVRALFLNIGMQFASRGIIGERRDIFYLTLEEIFGVIDNTAASYDLKGTVSLRKAEHERNHPERLPTRVFAAGIAGFSGRRFSPGETEAAAGDLHGVPCCAGRVTATARIIADPQAADFAPGQILVARSTDPGWIVLFSLAAGIIVERGSLLSHAAIVSREMGIPCIVCVQGATTRIPDGATVTMDGATGSIDLFEYHA